jgi:hypothetical protein
VEASLSTNVYLFIFGENQVMDCHSRSATIMGYALAVNKLIKLRNYPIPADLVDKDNMNISRH